MKVNWWLNSQEIWWWHFWEITIASQRNNDSEAGLKYFWQAKEITMDGNAFDKLKNALFINLFARHWQQNLWSPVVRLLNIFNVTRFQSTRSLPKDNCPYCRSRKILIISANKILAKAQTTFQIQLVLTKSTKGWHWKSIGIYLCLVLLS